MENSTMSSRAPKSRFKEPKSELTRLNKFLADCGLASRRHADKLISDGLVTVNGKKVFELGVKVDPREDRILVDGKPARMQRTRLIFAFNKPRGVLTTMEDPLDRPTIKDYFEEYTERIFPVGRLDWDSEGLLVLTNDGDLAQQIMHPKHEITKTYLVKVDGQPTPEHLDKLRRGVSIIGGKAKASHVAMIKRPKGSDQYAWIKIIITEGRNRQIRMMFEKIGFDVLKLQRVAIGRLKLGRMDRGEYAILDEADVQKIFLADDPDELLKKKSYAGRGAETEDESETQKAKNYPRVRLSGDRTSVTSSPAADFADSEENHVERRSERAQRGQSARPSRNSSRNARGHQRTAPAASAATAPRPSYASKLTTSRNGAIKAKPARRKPKKSSPFQPRVLRLDD